MVKKKTIALPHKIGWSILVFLVFWDGLITFLRGKGEGNPIWKPFVDSLGIHVIWVLAIGVLALFYFVVRIVGWYSEKHEGFPDGRGIVITSIVIAYGTLDLYLTLVFPYIGYLGFKNHYILIPIILAPVFIYNIWLEYLKRKKTIPIKNRGK